MSRLIWDQVGEKKYEHGIDRGVLYRTGVAVPWVGLISIQKSISGGGYNPYYLDGIKFTDEVERGNSQFSLEAIAFPTEFLPCDGIKPLGTGLYITNQPRESFALSYRTVVGNDVLGSDYGYKIHIINEAVATAQSRKNTSMADSTTPLIFSWDFETMPKYTTTRKPISHVVIDSTKFTSTEMQTLEDILYGTVSTSPRLPTQLELAAYLEV